MRRAGDSVATIATTLGMAKSTIVRDLKALREAGVDFGVLDKTTHDQAQFRSATNPANDPGRVAEQRHRILEMRLQGYQPRVIATTLGISSQQVSIHLAQAFNALNTPNADELRNIELERTDRLLLALEPSIDAGDVKAIAAATRISERRAALMGLNRPVQIEHTVLTVDLLDMEIRRLEEQLAGLTGHRSIDGEVVETQAHQ
jgi:DNA-binding CsgD family transcriptional regulator